jgi:hypothetical protein
MATRFQNARDVQKGGACNPSGIAKSLVEACAECTRDNASQREDPAVRLIVHQLAYLCNVSELDYSGDEYAKLMEFCEARISEAGGTI